MYIFVLALLFHFPFIADTFHSLLCLRLVFCIATRSLSSLTVSFQTVKYLFHTVLRDFSKSRSSLHFSLKSMKCVMHLNFCL